MIDFDRSNALPTLKTWLSAAVADGGSDLFFVPGAPVMLKRKGRMCALTAKKLSPADTRALIDSIYNVQDGESRNMRTLIDTGDDDFSFTIRDVGRFRCNAYRQRNSLAAVLRVVPFGLPDADALMIPRDVMSLADLPRGLVLVTGAAGAGKSTTLACLIHRINRTRSGHIVTIEDPIEFLHPHGNCIVSQREVSHDTDNFSKALRAALRQAPDVVLLGEMRDTETIQTAMTAAETGHLLFSTLHTVGAAKTIDRVIDAFPAVQQQQVRAQLSLVLEAVVSQQLVPTKQGELVPAFEVMHVNRAIRNMIREGKIHQIDNVIAAHPLEGMRTMEQDLLRLYENGYISRETALQFALQPDIIEKKL
ncbi:MAG: PilT/PilU family type 4a pilus ATPase [Clostridiales bacterium]|nr:PilT/PilU family type 4a pilus ATPase [Clostridiales bacterium]